MIGDDVAAALPEMRAHAESLMRGRCTIDRGTSEWNGTKTVDVWEPVHEDVPCRLEVAPVASRSLLADEVVTAEAPVVKVPVRFEGIRPDDRVTLADGQVLWVTHVPVYDDMVQRRIVCRWTR